MADTEKKPSRVHRETKVVRIKRAYADAAEIEAKTASPVSSATQVLNGYLERGGIKKTIKKINRRK